MSNELKYPEGVVWLIGQCMEAKGKQDLWHKTRPEAMGALREIAIIQSAESSNRIEGVEVEKDRLLPLLSGKVRPIDRPEEEVLGYKNALSWIHKNYKKVEINSETLLRLHLFCQENSSGDAGKFKKKNNEIIEIFPNGERVVRFVPVSAEKTPNAIEQMCLKYRHCISQQDGPDLGIVANTILDFLCIHPFRDGNGRVSRLLTILLLYQNNYEIGKYISLERIVEEQKEDYYSVLKKSSQDWHEGNHDPFPWMMFFVSHIRRAYNELSEKVEKAPLVESRGGKTDVVKKIILSQVGPFSLKEIERLCPSVSNQLIKKVLTEFKRNNIVKLEGKGRGASWKVIKRGKY
ncbi:MAG: Fic family protein [Bacteriovoracaceae bacterium]